MRLLAIETAGKACSIALFEGDALVASREEELGRGHAEALIPWIAELPEGGRADAILVGCGPGSFTGVRVGIAAARALGLGWGVPVTGMSSLALVAAGFDSARQFLVAVEGGHGELFVQAFNRDAPEAEAPMQSLKPEDVALHYAVQPVVGSGAQRMTSLWGADCAHPLQASATRALLLTHASRNLPAKPVYGRAADARPMA